VSNDQWEPRVWRSVMPMIPIRRPRSAADQVSGSSIRLITPRYTMRPHLRTRGIVIATHDDLLD
jgi:hypothetical protein